MNNMLFLWIAIIIVMAVIEGVTSQLVSIWFVIGAVAAAITAFFVPQFPIQLIVFVLVSLICLVATRPLVKKAAKTDFVPTNADRNIGKVAVVTQEINNALGQGQVKVEGKDWTARSVADDVIPEGAEVKVESISGVKLMVSAK